MADNLSTSGVLSGLEQEVPFELAGLGGVAIQIQGSFTGTVSFEATVQGYEYAPFRVTPSDSSTATDDATAPGLWTGSTVGYLRIRARMSAYSTGRATVFFRAILPPPGGAGGGGGVGSDVNLIEVGGESIALGQATMADSFPVTMASDQSAIAVTGAGTASDFGDPFPAAGTAIGINDPGGTMQPLSAETLDYDTGAGTVAQTVMGIALPGDLGPVAGGTSTFPIYVQPGPAVTVHLDGSSAYTDQAVIADPGDGMQAVITNIIGSTGAATALNFFLEEGATKIFGPIYLEAVAGRGFASGPIYLPCTASTAVTLTSSANIAQSYQISYFLKAV